MNMCYSLGVERDGGGWYECEPEKEALYWREFRAHFHKPKKLIYDGYVFCYTGHGGGWYEVDTE